jgi:hydroxymethylglutaryl-CoA lyase
MNNIVLHEVGLRDGLQMEKQVVATEQKIKWTEKLIEAGVEIVQLGSFVHPVKVPQMADTDELFQHFSKSENHPDNVIFSGLVLNEKGMERAIKCGVEMLCMGVSASDTHSQKNTGMTTSEAQDRIIAIAREAMHSGKKVQASVQSAFGCGFEGKIDELKVLEIIKKYVSNGIKYISLADTAGHANPAQVQRLFSAIRDIAPDVEIACHFHNTFGLGIINCKAAYDSGVRYFETAFGGIGGCPFTKVAAGNVCTEDFVNYMQRMGYRKDIKNEILIDLAKDLSAVLEKDLPGYVYKAGTLEY